MAIAFDAFTVRNAAPITTRLEEIPMHVGGLQFVGDWIGRRFVIKKLLPALGEVHSVTKDYAAGTITIPRSILISATDSVRELRSFGASVTRRKQSGSFDVVAGFDSETHFVPVGHHIALCGHRGPWPDASYPMTSPVSCNVCAKISQSKPKYRARFHPLSPGNQSK
ncbi:MAG: hypothetical protein KGN32_08095 [Burkholderiales bacterium]|nr:hypothetical protein [Burkholderiales bacterium]